MEQRVNIKFCVKLGEMFTETLAMLFAETYGDKVLWATYETPELSVEKFRRTKKLKKKCACGNQKWKLCSSFSTIRMGLNSFRKTRFNGDYWLYEAFASKNRSSSFSIPNAKQLVASDNNPAHKCIVVRKFLASKSVQILVLNHSPIFTRFGTMWLFFVLETKNKAEGRAVWHYFGHLGDFAQGRFDYLRKTFSGVF